MLIARRAIIFLMCVWRASCVKLTKHLGVINRHIFISLMYAVAAILILARHRASTGMSWHFAFGAMSS